MKKLITSVLLVTAMALTGCGDKKPVTPPAPKVPADKPVDGGATPATPPADTPAK